MNIKTLPLSVALAAISGVAAQAATIVNYDFSTSTQFTENFTPAGVTGGTLAWNAAGDVRLSRATDGTSFGVMRTNLAVGSFLTETVILNASSTAPQNDSSLGVYTRRQSNDTGVLGLVNFLSATTIQLRLFHGASLSGTTAGTVFYNSGTLTPANPLDFSNFTFTLTQTSGDDPIFNLTVSDSQGVVASTGSVALTATDAYNSGGPVGARLSIGNSGLANQYIAINSLQVIPEPSSLGLFMGVAVACFVVKRRRR